MVFFNWSDMPPEMLEELRKQKDQSIMQRDTDLHDFKNLMLALNKDQLMVLRRLLHIAAQTELTTYFEGQISAILLLNHSICTCGSDHAAELDEIKKDIIEGEGEITLAEAALEAESKEIAEATEAERMAVYGLTWLNTPGSDRKMICKGCGEPVHSLDDRILRPPGVKGCTTCQQKAKWG